MDTLRGFRDADNDGLAESAYSPVEDGADLDDDALMDAPPAFGTDERRMHVRAYNYWAKLLGERSFPSIEDLDPENIEDFGSHSVLLDFTSGMENPAIPFIGQALRDECDLPEAVAYLDQIPGRSLLSRITDHYLQIIANQAPIGFEAEFVNQRGATILYRGILLPFSSDDDTIDFIYGVINWKELADQRTTDRLIDEVNQAVRAAPRKPTLPVWADGPDEPVQPIDPAEAGITADPADFAEPLALAGYELPAETVPVDADNADHAEVSDAEVSHAEVSHGDLEAESEDDAPVAPDANAGLADWLAYARAVAELAGIAEDRSRAALYQAVGRAYDFALAARARPDEFAELIEDAGIGAQVRAPMTPVVKLVFGADYDKTRLAEYACVLGHAMRRDLGQGALADYLARYAGGLKGVVRDERAARQSKRSDRPDRDVAVRNKLRAVPSMPLSAVPATDQEFIVLVARRDADGDIGIVGMVDGADQLARQVLRKVAR